MRGTLSFGIALGLSTVGLVGFAPPADAGLDLLVAPFGGVYKTDDFAGCVVANPFAGGCVCPAGFVDLRMRFVSDLQNGGGQIRGVDVHACIRDLVAQGQEATLNFGGVYKRDDFAGCVVSNPLTQGCACPGAFGDVRLRAVSDQQLGGGPLRGVDLHVCVNTLPPLLPAVSSFGGVFKDDDFAGCVVANAFTGGCGCPGGFQDLRMRLVSDLQAGGGGIRGVNAHVCVQ